MTDDPTAWMDQAETRAGVLRIGMAHGSIQGFSGEGDAKVPIAPGRAERAKLDYLALGDWHGVTRISDRVWYSGTPEPDQFPANEPGFVLAVTLDGHAVPDVERVATAIFTWRTRQIDLAQLDDLAVIEREIKALGSASHRQVWKLIVTGALSLSDRAAVDGRLTRLRDDLKYLAWSSDQLRVVSGADDLALLGDGALKRVVQALQADAGQGGAQAALAERSLGWVARLLAADGAAT